MHKGIYGKMNRAARRAYRRRVTAGLCSLAMVFSGAAVQPSGWLMGGTVAAYAAETVPADAVQIDIGTLKIEDGQCIYIIGKDGDYHLTGSNLRNGVRVPTQIRVAEGVHANLYLDGVDIVNTNGAYGGCGESDIESTIPLDFCGDAVVYIVEDCKVGTNFNHAVSIEENVSVTVEEGRKLTVAADGKDKAGIQVDGTLYINGGEIKATAGDKGPGIGFVSESKGRIVINGGRVTAEGDWAAGIGAGQSSTARNGAIEIHGGEVYAVGTFYASGIGYGGRGTVASIWIDGGTIQASCDSYSGYAAIDAGDDGVTVIRGGYIEEGTSVAAKAEDNALELTGVTGESVTVMAGEIPDTGSQSVETMFTYKETAGAVSNWKTYGTADMKMSETGRISAAIPVSANRVDLVLQDNGVCKGYTMQVSGGALEPVSVYEPHRIIYRIMENGVPVDTLTGYTDSNGTTQLPSGAPAYKYTFTKDGKTFDGTGVTEDITVDAERTKRTYEVTYTGAYEGTKSIVYGESVRLAEGEPSWMYVDSTGKSATTVNGNMTVYVLDNSVTDEDGISYYVIKNESDFNTFVSHIKDGKGYLNGRLAADLTIADWTPFAETYRGTFDGAGHTITYHILENCEADTQTGMALFQNVNGAVIRNLRVDGTIYTKEKFAGGIVGIWNGKGLVENCSSDVEITFQPSGGTDASVGGIVGRMMGNGTVYLRNCLSSAALSGIDGLDSQGGFVGWADGKSVLENCFADDRHKAVGKVVFEVSGEPVSTVYTKKDGTVELPAVVPAKENYDFTGWYVGETPVTETTVLSGYAVAVAVFRESAAFLKERLRTMLEAAENTESGRVETLYTTASYLNYRQEWTETVTAARAVLENQTATAEEVYQAIDTFERDYAAAKAGLVQADGTAHIIYGVGMNDAAVSEDIRYASGDAVKLEAETARDGYLFRGWYEGDDTEADLNIVLSSTADRESVAGRYPITGAYRNDNYSIRFVNGTLTVKEGEPEPSVKPGPGTEPDVPTPTPEPDAPTPTPTPIPSPAPSASMGDVDGNGIIELQDAQLALKHALKIIELDESQRKRADVNNDDTIDISDATRILRAALKIESI